MKDKNQREGEKGEGREDRGEDQMVRQGDREAALTTELQKHPLIPNHVSLVFQKGAVTLRGSHLVCIMGILFSPSLLSLCIYLSQFASYLFLPLFLASWHLR